MVENSVASRNVVESSIALNLEGGDWIFRPGGVELVGGGIDISIPYIYTI